ncbi:hypothetical protein Y032_0249g120 [Ancylostoma ceylanicum]|uniref:Uncharacterized protein n=1 Tax=Ancylostoma ceylanicum TaxID=53326 RepID=A0A016SD47_9BILA|nr:hypothetical protein Y032_0249g120 [Ancylostoma ceylanicum]
MSRLTLKKLFYFRYRWTFLIEDGQEMTPIRLRTKAELKRMKKNTLGSKENIESYAVEEAVPVGVTEEET